jgi:hypothetical protein
MPEDLSEAGGIGARVGHHHDDVGEFEVGLRLESADQLVAQHLDLAPGAGAGVHAKARVALTHRLPLTPGAALEQAPLQPCEQVVARRFDGIALRLARALALEREPQETPPERPQAIEQRMGRIAVGAVGGEIEAQLRRGVRQIHQRRHFVGERVERIPVRSRHQVQAEQVHRHRQPRRVQGPGAQRVIQALQHRETLRLFHAAAQRAPDATLPRQAGGNRRMLPAADQVRPMREVTVVAFGQRARAGYATGGIVTRREPLERFPLRPLLGLGQDPQDAERERPDGVRIFRPLGPE